MSMRIVGFTDKGEVRLADEQGRIVAYGQLSTDAPSWFGVYDIEVGDRPDLSLEITWIRGAEADNELPEIDWDDLERQIGLSE